MEMLRRLKTAGEYQKKAMMALLPEQMERHLDVIEKEVKMMLAEMIAAAVREGRKADAFWDKQDYQKADASWGEQNHRKADEEWNRQNQRSRDADQDRRSGKETASVKKVDIE